VLHQAPAPAADLIPDKVIVLHSSRELNRTSQDLLDVTVLLLTCSCKNQEFIRIGYYVNNDFGSNQQLVENPPEQVRPHLKDIRREIVNRENPRVTRFQINWTDRDTQPPAELQMPQPQEVEDVGMEDDMDDDEESEEDEEGDEDDEIDLEEQPDELQGEADAKAFP
jgi:histone chaperone ASF1